MKLSYHHHSKGGLQPMSYTNWFIPLCIGVSIMFSIAIVILTIATLSFRSKVKRKYDRGKFSD